MDAMLRILLMGLIAIHASIVARAETKPERVILLYVDGLNPDAIDRFGLETMASMRERGASAEEGVMPFPAHPTTGPYGE
ncbi:MAG: hypothetical protein MI867_29530, partial [Pseudomonadales bacterium]|nr:hypothetical protein [Pseudomonadales bacterium]